MYSGSLSGTHKIRYRKILRGHHDVDVCFIQDMWGKTMHMHRAADLVTSERVGMKNVPGYFFLRLPDTLRKLPAACYADKNGYLCRIFLHHGNKIRCIIENRMV